MSRCPCHQFPSFCERKYVPFQTISRVSPFLIRMNGWIACSTLTDGQNRILNPRQPFESSLVCSDCAPSPNPGTSTVHCCAVKLTNNTCEPWLLPVRKWPGPVRKSDDPTSPTTTDLHSKPPVEDPRKEETRTLDIRQHILATTTITPQECEGTQAVETPMCPWMPAGSIGTMLLKACSGGEAGLRTPNFTTVTMPVSNLVSLVTATQRLITWACTPVQCTIRTILHR